LSWHTQSWRPYFKWQASIAVCCSWNTSLLVVDWLLYVELLLLL